MSVLTATPPTAPPRRAHVPAIAGCYFVASFAALGLPPYLTEILPSLGDPTGSWAGLLYVVPTVFSALGAPFWGRLADRYGRKRLLLRAQLGLSIAFLVAGFANSLPAFTLALVLQGFLGGTFAASNGYLAAALTGDRLSKALTLMQGSARAALVVAPILVGSLSPWVSPHRQYLLMAVLPLAAAVLLVFLPEPDHPAASKQVVPQQPPPSPRTLRLLYFFEFGFVFATIISFPYLIALIEQRMPDTSGAVAGVLFALPHLCYLVLASGVHRRFRDHPRGGLAAGFGFVAVGLAAHAVVRTLPGFVIARVLLGIGLTLGLVCLSILAADAARGRAPGRMFGTVEFFSKGGAVAAGAVAAVSNSAFGAAAPVLIGTVAALVTAVSATLLIRPRTTSESHMSVMQSLPPAATAVPRADHVVAHTLLNCLLRELSGPEHQSAVDDGWLLLRLPRAGVVLRVELRRTALIGAHRFRGPVYDESGAELTWHELADLVRRELALRSGFENEEFLPQIESSHEGVTRALTRTRPAGADRFLESEQAMLFGHRFHPAPKARTENRDDWAAYGPESRAAFQLRYLAVRAELLAEESLDPEITALVDNLREVPAGYRLLPAHPWQFSMMRDNPLFQAAVERGDVIDLGTGGVPFTATSSVRTLSGPDAFLKFSLNIRITNCLRKNAAYEMTGAVALTRLLAPVLADLAARFPGAAVLREPAFRTLALPGADGAADVAVYEGFGLIVRTGLNDVLRPGVTPLMAGAVADEYATSSAHISHLLDGADDAEIVSWWAAYLRLLIPPVLAAYFDHGVVLEPHLQNVLIGVDANNQPVQVLFRDLEGTKLVDELHTETLAGLPADVAGPMTYDAQRGWDRVVYCLLVNHVSDLLAAVADLSPALESRLWAEVRTVIAEYADQNGCPPLLAALLAGVPLPAKTNMLTRWGRLPDRSAGYVRLPSPLAESVLAAAAGER
ncbi:hypothetical protein GCM10009745_58280 [Kribbella yunnanensis]|uniref:Major facilitator superfamily (MFS) profile domain-containing protein n=1 Tax=Kribbella yunnanensis TaxID=190194 RepID=A0ABN2IE13_9ACTN